MFLDKKTLNENQGTLVLCCNVFVSIILGMKTILIVDDSKVMRDSLEEIVNNDPNLQVCGFAKDGAEAIKAASSLSPDLVLLDMEMPEWDGMGFLRHYRHEYSGKVIVLSAIVSGVMKPIGSAAEKHGADAVMPKPKGSELDGGEGELGTQLVAKIYEILGLC